MNLKLFYKKINKRFRELWEYKIFRFTIIIHFFYFILSIFLTLIFFRNQNDFLVYYKVGEVFITDINNLYTAEYLWPFRYLPISATLFIPFYLLGFDIGFITFNFINLLLNVLICMLIYKIIILVRREDHEREDKRIIFYISLFLLGLPNLFNYILGQINLYITFLILVSLFLFLKYENIKWDFIASIILGLSVIIKPITIFMIPFLLSILFKYQQRKFEFEFLRSIIRLVGVLLPLSLNLLFFIIFPNLWEGFISTNFTGEEPIILNHSFSLTKIITNFCIFYDISYNPLLILLIILFIIGGSSFLIFIFRKINNNSIIFAYLFGIIIMLLVYYDSWPHHLLVLTPILIILIFYIPKNSNITKNYLKPSFFFFNFFDLGFMGIWFITKEWFPFNFMSTVFLLITFYSVSRICLIKDSDYQKN
ncbi:MAG: glycosyltransferase family 87 protein [Promethearchaeota archaeon]